MSDPDRDISAELLEYTNHELLQDLDQRTGNEATR